MNGRVLLDMCPSHRQKTTRVLALVAFYLCSEHSRALSTIRIHINKTTTIPIVWLPKRRNIQLIRQGKIMNKVSKIIVCSQL